MDMEFNVDETVECSVPLANIGINVPTRVENRPVVLKSIRGLRLLDKRKMHPPYCILEFSNHTEWMYAGYDYNRAVYDFNKIKDKLGLK